MAGCDRQVRWYFDSEFLANSPSRKCSIDADKELSYRQQAANMIQDMGQRLQVTQLCINTAIVYMHRFYVFHSFTKYHRANIAACALFLAAKVEEQPRKLEHVIKVAHLIQHQKSNQLDLPAEAAKLIKNENIMLQTLGFDIAIEHPHTFVVKCCQMVRASKDLAQTCYFMATNSLHLTTMCLQYRPTVVACVCIHLACKWSNWQIPISNEGHDWYFYVDQKISLEKIEELTKEFLAILDKCPSRLKRKIMSGGGQGSGCDTLPPNAETGSNASQSQVEGRADPPEHLPSSSVTPSSNTQSSSIEPAVKIEQTSLSVPSLSFTGEVSKTSPSTISKEKQSYIAYREKKELEKRENEKREAERLEKEKKRIEAERQEQDRKAEADRRLAEQEQDRQRKEQEARDLEKKEAEKRAEQQRRLEAERLEKIRIEEKREAERRIAEKREADRRELERQMTEKAAQEAERQADLLRREAELRKQAELREEQKREEDERRRLKEELQRPSAVTLMTEDQIKREPERTNRFFTSRATFGSSVPAVTSGPSINDPLASFDDLIAKTRIDDLNCCREDTDRLSPGKESSSEPHQKHHKSEKSHKRKKSKHHKERHKEKEKDRSRDRRDKHEKQDSEAVPPLKLKIKPLSEPEPETMPESLKIRIPRDRLLNSSTVASGESDSSRKRKNSFDAGSISKKPVV